MRMSWGKKWFATPMSGEIAEMMSDSGTFRTR